MRVVSLVPSATEIVCLVGGRDLLVGRSHECDHPPGLEGLPVLTRSRTDPAAAARDIDREVRSQLAGGGSLYHLDEALLARLRPDVVITQDLCSVCSIDAASVRRAAEGITPPPRIVSLNPSTMEGVLDDVLTVGRALALESRAERELVRLRDRLFRAQEYVDPYADGPSVAVLEWTDPLFVAGHWTPQLVERAGARHPLNATVAAVGSGSGPQAATRVAGPSRAITPEELVASRPDALVVSPCGMPLERAMAEADRLSSSPWWGDLPAVRRGRVAVVDGNQMFSRPGPRLVDAMEWLVGWLNDRPRLIARDFPWCAMGS